MPQRPAAFGPVRPTDSSRLAWRPALRAAITGGFWAERRAVNRDVSVPSAHQRLQEAGNFHNLELAAGTATGDYVNTLPFLDSDLYKWLEAIGWTLADPELAAEGAGELRDHLEATTKLLATAQDDDGYLDSYFQVHFPGMRFEQRRWGHELYCAGHLIQAAVAVHRTSGHEPLLEVARRVADLVVASFGTEPGRIDGIDGHPEIETALVELYRETGHQPYLDAAQYFVDRRGHGLLGGDRFGAHYWQDHVPVREAQSVAGHSVRQVYLLAGVADLYAETGDESLRAAAERLWLEMVATRTYLTGGLGTHHLDEAFGDPYELTNERSYCETCAAIGSVMFSWRMLMITGEARYADLIERTLFNGFLAGLSLDGQRYIYANPLQVREGHVSGGNDHDYVRKPWFHCACCPPNVMRLLASLDHYVALASEREVRLHQFLTGDYTVGVAGGEARLRVDTDYPWDGRVQITIEEAPGGVWTLAVRLPHWAESATVTVDQEPVPVELAAGWLPVAREWRPGDKVVVEIPLAPRFTRADPRVDADRGLVAVERGPLVFCVEAADQAEGRLDDVLVDATASLAESDRIAELGGVISLRVPTRTTDRNAAGDWWPYPSASAAAPEAARAERTLVAVPYYAWGIAPRGLCASGCAPSDQQSLVTIPVELADAVSLVRREVAALHAELPRNGLVAWTAGNVSARVRGAELFVIKPSGVSYDELTPDSMVVCDLDGELVEGDHAPSSDTAAHAYVYQHLPEVNGVVHTHSPYATAWAARGEPIPCVLTMMGDEFGGEVPIGPFALIGDDSIGRGLVETLRAHRSNAVLMQNHGPFTVGSSARAAVKAAVLCEEVAKTVHLARQLGEPVPIAADDIDSLYLRYQNVYGQK